MWWQEWWVWGIGAMALAIVEMIVPGYVFLGFAIGAGAVAAALAAGPGIAGLLPASGAGLAVVFAVLSVLAWIAMRRFVGIRKGQLRIFDRDINED